MRLKFSNFFVLLQLDVVAIWIVWFVNRIPNWVLLVTAVIDINILVIKCILNNFNKKSLWLEFIIITEFSTWFLHENNLNCRTAAVLLHLIDSFLFIIMWDFQFRQWCRANFIEIIRKMKIQILFHKKHNIFNVELMSWARKQIYQWFI